MELQDGHVVYCTKKRTWYEVLLHELAFDNSFYCQSHRSFDFKYIPSHQRRAKEDRCNKPFYSNDFFSKNDSKNIFLTMY